MDQFLVVWRKIKARIANRLDEERSRPRPSHHRLLRLLKTKQTVQKHIRFIEKLQSTSGPAATDTKLARR